MYRNKNLLEAVRDFPCQICGAEDGTIVAAHSNQLRHGKGRGIKAHDYAIAALCYQCHMEIDQGNGSRESKTQAWNDAHINTLHLLFDRGIIEVRKH